MKRIFLTIPFLFFSFNSYGLSTAIQAVCGASGAAAPATFCASATATPNITGLLCDDGEGAVSCAEGYSSNCRAAWNIDSSTPDFDYTTSPAPLGGTYSFMLGGCINGADTRIYRTFTPTAGQPQELYFTFTLTEDGSNPATFVIAKLARSTSYYCTITLNSNKTLAAAVGGGSSVNTVGTISEDVQTHIWVRYMPGGGTDALCSVGFSTDGNRPTSGNNYAEATDGTTTLDTNRVYLWGDYANATSCNDIIIDNIFVDDATISGVPN